MAGFDRPEKWKCRWKPVQSPCATTLIDLLDTSKCCTSNAGGGSAFTLSHTLVTANPAGHDSVLPGTLDSTETLNEMVL